MATDRVVFISAGPSPRMRFKLVRCLSFAVAPDTDVRVAFHALAAGQFEQLGSRCDREIFVFFKNIALCPVHGIVQSDEPWVEEGGNHDN